MRLVGVEFAFFMILSFEICAVPIWGQQPPSPREQLKQYVADLQKNPSDDALRETIIKLVLSLNPKPAVPDDATVLAAKGYTIFSHAKETGSKDNLRGAGEAFRKASLLAPWVADYYYNQALVMEVLGQFDETIRAFNFYLLAKPNASDANEVRGRIEGLKYENEVAEKQRTHDADSVDKQVKNLLAGSRTKIRFLGEHDDALKFAIRLFENGSDYMTFSGSTERCPAFKRLVANTSYTIQFTNGGGGYIQVQGGNCSLMYLTPYNLIRCPTASKPYMYMAQDGSLSCGAEKRLRE